MRRSVVWSLGLSLALSGLLAASSAFAQGRLVQVRAADQTGQAGLVEVPEGGTASLTVSVLGLGASEFVPGLPAPCSSGAGKSFLDPQAALLPGLLVLRACDDALQGLGAVPQGVRQTDQ